MDGLARIVLDVENVEKLVALTGQAAAIFTMAGVHVHRAQVHRPATAETVIASGNPVATAPPVELTQDDDRGLQEGAP